MTIRYLIFFLVFLFCPLQARSAECFKIGSVCVDSTPCKTVSGDNVFNENVCLADFGLTCWEYEDIYSCKTKNFSDYCAVFRNMQECSQTNSVCAESSPDGSCKRWTNTFRCEGNFDAPENTVKLDTTYTIVKDSIDDSQCASLSSNPNCQLVSHVCSEPEGTRVINGLSVYKDCWAWQDTYACRGDVNSHCSDLEAKGCTLTSSRCIRPEGATDDACELKEKTYTCPTGEPTTSLDCGSQICSNGYCFDTSHTPDGDLASVVIAHEVGRQGEKYFDENTQRLFNGSYGGCTENGLENCCETGDKPTKNKSIEGKIISEIGGQIIYKGSAYVYDFVSSGIASSSVATGAAAAGSAAAGTAAAGSGLTIEIAGLSATFEGGSIAFAFDPASAALAAAIYIVTDLMSCEQSEKIVAQKIAAGLCRYYGSESNGFLGISSTHKYCCYNSKLARIINNAAVKQLGKADHDCSGITMDEFSRLDFSKIDMSDFVAEISSEVSLPSTDAINADVAHSVNQKLQNYFSYGNQGGNSIQGSEVSVSDGNSTSTNNEAPPVFELKNLMKKALASPDGTASGIIEGEMADNIHKATGSNDPVRAEISTVNRDENTGCSLLSIKLIQPNAPTQDGSTADFVMTTSYEMCE